MTKERKASVIYEGNASQLVYAFPFDYLRKKFVKVEDIDTNITELTIGVDYTVEDKQVKLAKGIPIGHYVKIYRKTATDPLVEWQDASVLRSADLSLQEVQLLHLAEEALDMAQDKGLTTDDNDGVWDARYNKIKNLLEPTEAGDAVNLGYITKNQDSLLNKLNSTGATQNKSIVATGDAQNARLIATGEAQNTRLLATGDNKNKTLEDTGDAQNERLIATGNEQNTRLTVTGTYQNKLVTDTGKSYVSTMTTLKDTVVNKANEVNSSADLAKKWAMSDTSPDGVEGNKSSKTWAEEAKASVDTIAAHAAAAKASELASATSKDNAAKSANAASTYANAAYNSRVMAGTMADNAAKSATDAANSLTQLGTHEANAAASAAAAAKSAENAKLWDPTNYYTKTETYTKEEVDNKISGADFSSYYTKEEVDAKIPTKTSQLTNDSSFTTQYYVRVAINQATSTIRNEIPSNLSQLTNDVNYATTTDVEKAVADSQTFLKTQIPKATSQLTNDSDFVTSSQIPTVPTKTSQLTNDSGFAVISNGHLVINEAELWIE
nr:MAG TPA: tail fiber protein [Caudoviricetes sp.]